MSFSLSAFSGFRWWIKVEILRSGKAGCRAPCLHGAWSTALHRDGDVRRPLGGRLTCLS